MTVAATSLASGPQGDRRGQDQRPSAPPITMPSVHHKASGTRRALAIKPIAAATATTANATVCSRCSKQSTPSTHAITARTWPATVARTTLRVTARAVVVEESQARADPRA
jgi:hypothetical protein